MMLKNQITFILLTSICFHAVGIIPNIDVQPSFFLLTSLTLILIGRFLKFKINELLLVTLVIGLFFWASLLQFEFINIKYLLTYTVSILSFWYMIVLLRNNYLNITCKVIWIIVSIYTIVGIIQFYIPDFLSFLVTRSEEAALSFSSSGRGVRSLTGEPAHLGKIFAFLNILLLFVSIKEGNNSKFKLIVFTILLFLINVIISRSAYAIAFHGLMLATLMFFLYRKLFFISLFSFMAGTSLIITYLINFETDLRFLKLFVAVYNNPDFIMAQGAFKRLFNLVMSFNNLTYFDWYGAGNNPYSPQTSIQTPFGEYYYNVNNRGYGGYFEFVLKLGVLSLPIMICYTYILFRISKFKVMFNHKKYSLGLFFFMTLFIYTIQDGTPVNPLPIYVLLYIYFNIVKSSKKDNTLHTTKGY